jgi:hypothetical protein
MKSDYNQKCSCHRYAVLSVMLLAGFAAGWATGGTTGGTGSNTNASDPAYAGLDETTIAEIRAGFTEAVESMAATEKAIRAMDVRFPEERLLWPPMARAYRASLEGLIGKHSPKLLDKLHRVNAAIADYHGLIEAYPGSLELRFMRFAFYSQLPGLFGVGSHVKPDRAVLTDMLEQGDDKRVPDSQKLEMISWILKDGKPEKAETTRLQGAAARLGGRL